MAYGSGYADGYAAAEPAAGVLTRHSSSPPALLANSTSVTTFVTANFTPPAGSLLLVLSMWDTQSTVRTCTTVTDLGSTSAWQRVVFYDDGGNGLVAIDYATVLSSTATRVRNTYDGGATFGAMSVSVITGQASQPIGASGAFGSPAGTSSTVNWTTTTAGSKLFAVYEDYLAGTSPSNAAFTVIGGILQVGNLVCQAYMQTGTAGAAGSANTTTFSSTEQNSALAWVEILPGLSSAGSGSLSGAGTVSSAARSAGAGGLSGVGALSGSRTIGAARTGAVSGVGALAGSRTIGVNAARGLSGVGRVVGTGGPTYEQFVYRPTPPPDLTHPVSSRYIAQRILTGEFLSSELPITTSGPTFELSGPGSLQGTINPEIGQLVDSNGELILQEWSTAIYHEADGQIRWGGILIRSGFTGASWEIEAAGFITYPNGIPYTGTLYSKISVDPTQIVGFLWNHVQQQPDGNLGMELVLPDNCPVRLGTPAVAAYDEVQLDSGQWVLKSEASASSLRAAASSTIATAMTAASTLLTLKALSNFDKPGLPFYVTVSEEDMQVTARSGLKLTVVRGYNDTTAAAHSVSTAVTYAGTPTRTVEAVAAEPYQLAWWDSTDVGGEISKLAQETPFDYTEQHFWDGESIRHRLIVSYPRIGRKRDDLAFVQGANVSSVVPVTRNGDTYANTVLGIGKGEGAASLRSEVATRDGRLRRPVVFVDKTAGTSSRLSALTRAEHTRHQLLPEIASITVDDHPNARIGSWSVGDDILVRADLPWIGYTAIWCRVISWAMNGETKATINLQRSDSFIYGQGSAEGMPSAPVAPPATASYPLNKIILSLETGKLPGTKLLQDAEFNASGTYCYMAQEVGGSQTIHRFKITDGDPVGRYTGSMTLTGDSGHGGTISVWTDSAGDWIITSAWSKAVSIRWRSGSVSNSASDTRELGGNGWPGADQAYAQMMVKTITNDIETYKLYGYSGTDTLTRTPTLGTITGIPAGEYQTSLTRGGTLYRLAGATNHPMILSRYSWTSGAKTDSDDLTFLDTYSGGGHEAEGLSWWPGRGLVMWWTPWESSGRQYRGALVVRE